MRPGDDEGKQGDDVLLCVGVPPGAQLARIGRFGGRAVNAGSRGREGQLRRELTAPVSNFGDDDVVAEVEFWLV
jgi:hypothetical protein